MRLRGGDKYMKHKKFEIQNFKGITKVSLDFSARPTSRIYTLVGLNESGKTTILEALDFWVYKSETLDPLGLPSYAQQNAHDLIPISQRANFNDSIIIKAYFELDEADEKKIHDYLKNEIGFTLSGPIKNFYIEQKHHFTNSKLDPNQPSNSWSIPLRGKSKGARIEKELWDLALTSSEVRDRWRKAITYVSTLLPSVLYFPNFLFEFPDKIYLEAAANDDKIHKFYRTVLQDVLDAIGGGLNLTTHVLDRAKENDRFSKTALDSTLAKMGHNISSNVFKNWDKIFKRKVGNKEITVSCDKDEAGRWYVQLRLKDGSETYAISERSLGFRWFFSFLLLTHYRGFRNDASGNVLFLFDEPASNLHPSAQSQLVESFGKLSENCFIVYTTHSHHMVNPEWLETTYVVKNEGLEYSSEVDDYDARKTQIVLSKYRQFAAQHPNQTTYFQPILDVLQYNPGRLENVPDVIMVEGKNDYYTLKYFQDKILKPNKRLNLMPGGGSGSLDSVIRLYAGWGRRFLVLLDSDKAGEDQKKRYTTLFGPVVEGKIFSLEDVDNTWKNKGMETLFEAKDLTSIQAEAYPDVKDFSKTYFNRALQELFLTDKSVQVSPQSTENIAKLLTFLSGRFKDW